MIRSFRILVGTVKQYVKMFSVLIGGMAVIGVIDKLVKYEWLSGIISGFVPVFSAITLPTFTLVTLIGVFNTNSPETIGYKYYHSLPNSAEHFRNSVIFTNVLAVVILAAFMAVVALFFNAETAMCAAAITLFTTGIMNFMGYTKLLWLKLIPLGLAGGFAGGFGMGFSAASEITIEPSFYVVMLGVSAAVFAAGVVFAVVKAKSAWESEGEKCAD